MPSVPELEILAQTSALPFVNEFIRHPDFTQIAAFFSGWVFISSVLSIVSSQTIRAAVQQSTTYLSVRSSAPSNFPVAICDNPRKLDLQCLHSDDDRHHDHFLILLLCICFALSSIAYFTSLLTYNARVSSIVCAFVIASGGIFAGCGRLFGLVTLVLELWRLGANIKEMVFIAAWILAAVALMITEHSTSVGTTGFLPQLGTYICYRIRYLPISLASSLVNLAIETYILIRLLWLIARNLLGSRRRMTALRDTRSLRTSSLIVLELLAMIPTITFVGRIGEFVPFAIGSLLVLVTFNKPVDCQASCLGTLNLTPSSSRPPQRLNAPPHVFPHAHGYPRHGISAVLVSAPPPPAAIQGSLTSFEKPPNAERASTVQDASWPKPPLLVNETLLSITVAPPVTSAPPACPTTSIRGNHGITSDNAVPGKARRKNRIVDHPEVFAEVEKALRDGLPIPPPLKIHIPAVVPPHKDSPKRHSSSSGLGGSDIIRRGAPNNTDPPRTSVYPAAERSATTFTQSWTSLVRSPVSNYPLPSPKHSNRWLMFGGNSTSPTRRLTFSDLSMMSAGDRTTFGGRRPLAYDDLVTRMNPMSKEMIAVEGTDKVMETLQRGFEIDLARRRRYRELLRTRIRGPRPLIKVVSVET